MELPNNSPIYKGEEKNSGSMHFPNGWDWNKIYEDMHMGSIKIKLLMFIIPNRAKLLNQIIILYNMGLQMSKGPTYTGGYYE